MKLLLSRMGSIYLFLICVLFVSPILAVQSEAETYLDIRLFVTETALPDLSKIGIYPDHVFIEKIGTQTAIRLVLSESETYNLRKSGLPFEIISPDLSKKYQLDLKRQKQAAPSYFAKDLPNLKPGSMGGILYPRGS